MFDLVNNEGLSPDSLCLKSLFMIFFFSVSEIFSPIEMNKYIFSEKCVSPLSYIFFSLTRALSIPSSRVITSNRSQSGHERAHRRERARLPFNRGGRLPPGCSCCRLIALPCLLSRRKKESGDLKKIGEEKKHTHTQQWWERESWFIKLISIKDNGDFVIGREWIDSERKEWEESDLLFQRSYPIVDCICRGGRNAAENVVIDPANSSRTRHQLLLHALTARFPIPWWICSVCCLLFFQDEIDSS